MPVCSCGARCVECAEAAPNDLDRALFADEKGMPLEASHMDDATRDAFIVLKVAPEQARKHSWHSYQRSNVSIQPLKDTPE